jgi:hypothetical protein
MTPSGTDDPHGPPPGLPPTCGCKPLCSAHQPRPSRGASSGWDHRARKSSAFISAPLTSTGSGLRLNRCHRCRAQVICPRDAGFVYEDRDYRIRVHSPDAQAGGSTDPSRTTEAWRKPPCSAGWPAEAPGAGKIVGRITAARQANLPRAGHLSGRLAADLDSEAAVLPAAHCRRRSQERHRQQDHPRAPGGYSPRALRSRQMIFERGSGFTSGPNNCASRSSSTARSGPVSKISAVRFEHPANWPLTHRPGLGGRIKQLRLAGRCDEKGATPCISASEQLLSF